MHLLGSSSARLRDSAALRNNSAERGGGVSALGASLSLRDVELVENAASDGGALYASGATLLIDSTVARENMARDHGGAVAVVQATQLSVRSSHLSRNRCEAGLGGAMRVERSSVQMDDVVLEANAAGSGGEWPPTHSHRRFYAQPPSTAPSYAQPPLHSSLLRTATIAQLPPPSIAPRHAIQNPPHELSGASFSTAPLHSSPNDPCPDHRRRTLHSPQAPSALPRRRRGSIRRVSSSAPLSTTLRRRRPSSAPRRLSPPRNRRRPKPRAVRCT